MICPHCQKDTDRIYLKSGQVLTHEEAKTLLAQLIRTLESLEKQGAHSSQSYNGELNRRYDDTLDLCSELEAGLGY